MSRETSMAQPLVSGGVRSENDAPSRLDEAAKRIDQKIAAVDGQIAAAETALNNHMGFLDRLRMRRDAYVESREVLDIVRDASDRRV